MTRGRPPRRKHAEGALSILPCRGAQMLHSVASGSGLTCLSLTNAVRITLF